MSDLGQVIGIVGGICGIIGAACCVQALLYVRKLKIAERQKAWDAEDAKWVGEFTALTRILFRIRGRRLNNQNAYEAVFPDAELRSRIENHLIGVDRLTPRKADVNLLRVPDVRQTIEQAKQQIEQFTERYPEHRAELDLREPQLSSEPK